MGRFGGRAGRACPAMAWAAVAVLVAASDVSADGVTVALLPSVQTVAPGSEFDLSLEVTVAGASFSGFDAYIGFDPSALTMLPTSPTSLQEGAYFAAACANRFHKFMVGADRDTIVDALLCASTSLTGPGQIYKLRFRASSTPQTTTVRFLPGLQFYNAGLFVNPAHSTDAEVQISPSLGVGDAPPRPAAMRLSVSPNPSRRATSLVVEADRPGIQQLSVVDLQGRMVRRLESGSFPAGKRAVVWDGRGDSGARTPPGAYLAVLRASGKTFRVLFTMLD